MCSKIDVEGGDAICSVVLKRTAVLSPDRTVGSVVYY